MKVRGTSRVGTSQVEGKLPGVSGERPDVAEHPAGAQRPKFLLTASARPCEPSVGGDGRRRRARRPTRRGGGRHVAGVGLDIVREFRRSDFLVCVEKFAVVSSYCVV